MRFLGLLVISSLFGQEAVPTARLDGPTPNTYVEFTYLYLAFLQENLAYAYNTSPGDEASVFYPDRSPYSGFRVLLESDLYYDGWDMQFSYFWLNRDEDFPDPVTPTSATPNDTYSTWYVPNNWKLPDDLSSAQWRVFFSRFDFTLGRSFLIGQKAFMRGFGGISVLWDEQDLNIIYPINSMYYLWRNTYYWWGAGPLFGFSVEYQMFMTPIDDTHALFGDYMVSLPWCRADSTMNRYNNNTPDTEDSMATYRDLALGIMPFATVRLGYSWNTPFDDWSVRLKLAWEQNIYFAHNRFFSEMRYHHLAGNFYVQGLNISFALGF